MYGISSTTDYFGELTKVKQDGYSYDHYQTKFMRLSHQVRGIPSKYLVSFFITGLRETMKLELMSGALRSVIEAIKLERIEEENASVLRKGGNPLLVKHIPMEMWIITHEKVLQKGVKFLLIQLCTS